MTKDSHLIFEMYKHVKESATFAQELTGSEAEENSSAENVADGSEETTAYKLGKITSKLMHVKRRLQLNAQEQTTFSTEEMMQDVQQALDLLDTIRHPYVS